MSQKDNIINLQKEFDEKAKEIEKICHSVKLEKATDRIMSCSIGVAIYRYDIKGRNDNFNKKC